MLEAAQDILQLINMPFRMAGKLIVRIRKIIADNPGVTAGGIVSFVSALMNGKSVQAAARDTGIGMLAGRMIEEMIKDMRNW